MPRLIHGKGGWCTCRKPITENVAGILYATENSGSTSKVVYLATCHDPSLGFLYTHPEYNCTCRFKLREVVRGVEAQLGRINKKLSKCSPSGNLKTFNLHWTFVVAEQQPFLELLRDCYTLTNSVEMVINEVLQMFMCSTPVAQTNVISITPTTSVYSGNVIPQKINFKKITAHIRRNYLNSFGTATCVVRPTGDRDFICFSEGSIGNAYPTFLFSDPVSTSIADLVVPTAFGVSVAKYGTPFVDLADVIINYHGRRLSVARVCEVVTTELHTFGSAVGILRIHDILNTGVHSLRTGADLAAFKNAVHTSLVIGTKPPRM